MNDRTQSDPNVDASREVSSVHSVTTWLELIKQGRNDQATQALWNRYFAQLVQRARRSIKSSDRRASDEEDVALSAFQAFCQAAEQGRFPQLADRNDLWKLLLTITQRKADNYTKHARRAKRGGGKILSEAGDSANRPTLDQYAAAGPTPDFAAQVAEECQRLLNVLGDDELRQISIWRMEGYSVIEVAEKLGCSDRTVIRRIKMIEALWTGTLQN